MSKEKEKKNNFVYYLNKVAQNQNLKLDEMQAKAAENLDLFFQNEFLNKKLFFFSKKKVSYGFYIWGGVGRGKSFIMDSFFSFLPTSKKKRIHYHSFMSEIYKSLSFYQGTTNPLKSIAKKISAEYNFLFIDEFQINDIGDAMIMFRLLDSLFKMNVDLFTTSNTEPKNLYLHGLQREQFLPAIDLIENKLKVFNLDGNVDYRLKEFERKGVFHIKNSLSEDKIEKSFNKISGRKKHKNSLVVNNRIIKGIKIADNICWFDFYQICTSPRSTLDYIELAKNFNTVCVSNVPIFQIETNNERKRFTWMIDEFYDRKVKLILSIESHISNLFQNLKLDSEIERTLSRLTEMETKKYLSKAHIS